MRTTRKDFLRQMSGALLTLPLAILLEGAGQRAPTRRIVLDAKERAALKKISAYLNSITTLKGRFTQIAPQGQMLTGTFYLKRPGRVRFIYDKPSPVLVVSDGKTIAVANSQLRTVDHYDLSDTPFGFIIGDDIQLARTKMVLGVDQEPGIYTVRARTSKTRFTSNMRFVFSAAPDIELRQWTVTDPQGKTTTVSLSDLQPGAAVPPDAFVLPKESDFTVSASQRSK